MKVVWQMPHRSKVLTAGWLISRKGLTNKICFIICYASKGWYNCPRKCLNIGYSLSSLQYRMVMMVPKIEPGTFCLQTTCCDLKVQELFHFFTIVILASVNIYNTQILLSVMCLDSFLAHYTIEWYANENRHRKEGQWSSMVRVPCIKL